MTTARVEMVDVPAAWFWMGWGDGAPGEAPRHRVRVDAFAIGRRPVTNAEYAPYLAATGAAAPAWWQDPDFAASDQPVVGVSWHDAMGFCAWLGTALGRACRLPTEAQWERAARGGLDDARFPWGDRHPGTGRFPRPPRPDDTPANPFGLLGLSGVCHEWCLDWESETYYAESPTDNPRGPESGNRRISRGGAWRHQDPWSPVAHRSSLPPQLAHSDYGFRVVVEI